MAKTLVEIAEETRKVIDALGGISNDRVVDIFHVIYTDVRNSEYEARQEAQISQSFKPAKDGVFNVSDFN